MYFLRNSQINFFDYEKGSLVPRQIKEN
jgi:hypothetical protein